MTDQSDRAPEGHDPEKRRRLVEAAAEEFARVGFERTAIETIAQRAGVAKGTVYLYFESKPAVFLAVLQELRRRLDAMPVAAGATGTTPGLRAFIRAHLLLADEAPDLFRCYTSALFGVNRDFQGAALEIFAWQTQVLERLLAPANRGKSSAQRQRRAALAAGSILSAALVRGLHGRTGRSTAFEEESVLSGALGS
ncbi:MAG: TetR/AcrR family transcriptional regulator [Dehalococcoidia bacterium]